MRASGVRGLLICCSDYNCSHHSTISGDRWPDDVRLSDIEPRFICEACGQRGADVRPNFHWEQEADSVRQDSGRFANLWEEPLYEIDCATCGADIVHGLQLADGVRQNIIEIITSEDTFAR